MSMATPRSNGVNKGSKLPPPWMREPPIRYRKLPLPYRDQTGDTAASRADKKRRAADVRPSPVEWKDEQEWD